MSRFKTSSLFSSSSDLDMAKAYADKQEDLKPAKLPVKTLTEIGRLIRAFAEIEDIIDLYIAGLAGITEAQTTVLLGKTAITRRLEMAENLARMTGENITDLHKQLFNQGYKEALGCRNAVAHGTLIGKTEEARYAFLTATQPEKGPTIRIVESYTHEDIRHNARQAEAAIPILEKHLKLQAQRKERLQRPLLPHRRAQRRANAKQKPPPRSSQA